MNRALITISRRSSPYDRRTAKKFFKSMAKTLAFFWSYAIIKTPSDGDMAQLVERYVRNVQATSSNLVISTKRNLKRTTLSVSRFRFFLFVVCESLQAADM